MNTKFKFMVGGMLMGAAIALAVQYQEIARLRDKPNSPPTASAQPKPATPASLAGILNLSGKNEIESMREVLDYVDHLNPADARGALDALEKLPHNAAADFAKKLILARWAEANPAAALAWAKSRTLYDGRSEDIATVFDTWAAKDPKAALAAVSQVDDAHARAEIYQNIFTRLAATDPVSALATLRSLPAGQQSLNAYGEVFYTWALQDPKAASLAAQNLPPSLARNQAIQQLAAGWAQEDPAAALTWANGLPAGNSRTSALTSVLTAIAAQDPQTGATYLASLPNGAAKDSLVVSFADNFLSSDPAGMIDGTNEYTYVKDNPETHFDPEGLATEATYLDEAATAENDYDTNKKNLDEAYAKDKSIRYADQLALYSENRDKQLDEARAGFANLEATAKWAHDNGLGFVDAAMLDDDKRNPLSGSIPNRYDRTAGGQLYDDVETAQFHKGLQNQVILAGATVGTGLLFEAGVNAVKAAWAAKSVQAAESVEAKGGTYLLRDPETGTVMRTGRTNDLVRREAEHARDPVLGQFNFEAINRTDVYSEQRGLEQILHDTYQPPLNKIGPISPTNPNKPLYMDAAQQYMQGGGG